MITISGIRTKKAEFLQKHHRLYCEACGFDFGKTYGERGEGIIDVHHTLPLHELSKATKTTLEDLALLCANCHRVVHAKRKWLSMEALKGLVDQ